MAVCTARLHELAAEPADLGIVSDSEPVEPVRAAAAAALEATLPRVRRDVGADDEASCWAACALWATAVNHGSTLRFADLRQKAGVPLSGLIASPGYLAEWVYLRGLPQTDPVSRSLSELRSAHKLLASLRVKRAQMHGRRLSALEEEFGWCLFIVANRSCHAGNVLPEQPEMVRMASLLRGVLVLMTEKTASAAAADGLEEDLRGSDPSGEGFRAVSACFRGLFDAASNPLSPAQLQRSLETLRAAPIESGQELLDGRWYATDTVLKEIVGDTALCRQVVEARARPPALPAEPAAPEPASPARARGGYYPANRPAVPPMSPQQSQQLDTTMAAQIMAEWGVDGEVTTADTAALHPPGTPVTGVIDANTWVNERVREVDGACLPNRSAAGSAHGVLGWICTDCNVPIAALQARADEMKAKVETALAERGGVSRIIFDYCWHLGCILPRVPAMIVRTGGCGDAADRAEALSERDGDAAGPGPAAPRADRVPPQGQRPTEL